MVPVSSLTKVRVLHLGQRGAGPLIALRIAEELDARGNLDRLTVSKRSEIAKQLTMIGSNYETVDTYKSVWGLIAAVPRLVFWSIRYVIGAKGAGVSAVVSSMESPLQIFVAIFCRLFSLPYYSSVHDVEMHAGDHNRLVIVLRWFEVLLSSAVLVYSAASFESAKNVRPTKCRELILVEHGPLMGVRPDSSADWPPSRIGFFGRLKKYKGVDVAIEAVAAVREKFPELTLDIIGEGDRHLVSESKHFGAPWLKLQLGWVDDSLIPDVLSELDLLVLPYQEATQSGVIAVAAALRLPVVVTPVGALPDQIDALGCGIVAPNCGVEDISYAVMRMIESRDLFQSCQGSQALESWGWSSGVDKILSSIANRCELAG